MLDMGQDIKLALVVIMFIMIVKWTNDKLEKPVLGVIIAAILSYLTFFSHYDLLVLAFVVVFVWPFIIAFLGKVGWSLEDK